MSEPITVASTFCRKCGPKSSTPECNVKSKTKMIGPQQSNVDYFLLHDPEPWRTNAGVYQVSRLEQEESPSILPGQAWKRCRRPIWKKKCLVLRMLQPLCSEQYIKNCLGTTLLPGYSVIWNFGTAQDEVPKDFGAGAFRASSNQVQEHCKHLQMG